MDRKIIAIFADQKKARIAIERIRKLGFEKDISLIAKDGERENTALTMGGEDNTNYSSYPILDNKDKGVTTFADYPEKNNVASGTLGGGLLGGLAALAISAGLLTIPGIGPLVAAGPISATLSGAVVGGITGALTDWGIPQAQSADYEEKLKQGRVFVGLECSPGQEEAVKKELREAGAEQIQVY